MCCFVCAAAAACTRSPEPTTIASGTTFDLLAVRDAMQFLGMPPALCDAAGEVVVDLFQDCVEAHTTLPSALVRAGVTPVGALRVHAVLVKVRAAVVCCLLSALWEWQAVVPDFLIGVGG